MAKMKQKAVPVRAFALTDIVLFSMLTQNPIGRHRQHGHRHYIMIVTTLRETQQVIDKLSGALNFHREALNLRAERHEVLAANIANADTPNYKARDMDFAKELSRVMESGRADTSALSLTTTSARHIPAQTSAPLTQELLYRTPDQPSLDGNTVDMDRERTQFADNAVRYQASLTMINSRIQGLKSAMQSE